MRLMGRLDALPHALLIHGRPGLGKTLLGLQIAQRLLCESATGTTPGCGACASCRWFELGNHPDFRLVQPDALAVAAVEGDAESADKPSGGAAGRQIRVDQVRELQAFLRIGTHRGGFRIALIRPAEAMNPATANALLKSLEEPPPGTLMLLVSSDPRQLLPTVRSRCQSLPVLVPDHDVAAQWLRGQAVADAEAALSFAAGAPLAAIEQADQADQRARLVDLLATPQLDPMRGAEQLAGSGLPDVVIWLQKWIYDVLRVRSGGRPRYHPGASGQLEGLARRTDAIRLSRFAARLTEARALAGHPLNPRLFLEDLLMQYRSLSGGRDGG